MSHSSEEERKSVALASGSSHSDTDTLKRKPGLFYRFIVWPYSQSLLFGSFAHAGIAFLATMEIMMLFGITNFALTITISSFVLVACFIGNWGLETSNAQKELKKHGHVVDKWWPRYKAHVKSAYAKGCTRNKFFGLLHAFWAALPKFRRFVPDFILLPYLMVKKRWRNWRHRRYVNKAKSGTLLTQKKALKPWEQALLEKSWLSSSVTYLVKSAGPAAEGFTHFMGMLGVLAFLGAITFEAATSFTGGLPWFAIMLGSMVFLIAATQNYHLPVKKVRQNTQGGLKQIKTALKFIWSKERSAVFDAEDPHATEPADEDDLDLKLERRGLKKNKGFFERWMTISLFPIVALLGPFTAFGAAALGVSAAFWAFGLSGPWIMIVAGCVGIVAAIQNLSLEVDSSLEFLYKIGRGLDRYFSRIFGRHAPRTLKGKIANAFPRFSRFIPDLVLKFFGPVYHRDEHGKKTSQEKSWLYITLSYVLWFLPLAHGAEAYRNTMIGAFTVLGLHFTGLFTSPSWMLVVAAVAFGVACIQNLALEVPSAKEKILTWEEKVKTFFCSKRTLLTHWLKSKWGKKNSDLRVDTFQPTQSDNGTSSSDLPRSPLYVTSSESSSSSGSSVYRAAFLRHFDTEPDETLVAAPTPHRSPQKASSKSRRVIASEDSSAFSYIIDGPSTSQTGFVSTDFQPSEAFVKYSDAKSQEPTFSGEQEKRGRPRTQSSPAIFSPPPKPIPKPPPTRSPSP